MSTFITVRPARELRADFARWAVAQDPKLRTVSPLDFAVPNGSFTGMPEHLLIGALVDGHPYVSPDEQGEPTEPASGPTLLGVDQPEAEGIPGEPLAELPADAQPLDVHPAEGNDAGDAVDPDDDRPKCAACDRAFKSDRALAAHRRQSHPED
ncbi:hypothetical protein ABZ682_23125 [Streptomyces griseoviridis]|uniref:hypothetical protein n=1 Tax=Streptomyces griseoviridis TaxID=45398 RepID=UPI0033EB7564